MNKTTNQQYLKYALFLIIGFILAYLLLPQGIISGTSAIPTGLSCSTENVSTTPPTQVGDSVCTTVCIRTPDECPRTCPIGTHWQCSGTLAMNCGCFPDGEIVTTTTIPECPEGMIYDTGRQTCVTEVI